MNSNKGTLILKMIENIISFINSTKREILALWTIESHKMHHSLRFITVPCVQNAVQMRNSYPRIYECLHCLHLVLEGLVLCLVPIHVGVHKSCVLASLATYEQVHMQFPIANTNNLEWRYVLHAWFVRIVSNIHRAIDIFQLFQLYENI